MTIRIILCLLTAFYSFEGYAQAKVPSPKHKSYLTLIESYTQQTIPGRREAKRQTATHFIIVWEEARCPVSFFWRGDSGFVACSIAKASRIVNKPHNFQQGIDYTTEGIVSNNIHKGDTLQLTPEMNNQFPLPAEIPNESKNTLFFKTSGSKWLSVPITNITKKRPIMMP